MSDDEYMYDEEDGYADDYYDVTIEGEEGAFEDDGVVESLLIVGITMSLVFLVWWRQRIQQANARGEEVRRQEQGLPPHQAPAPQQQPQQQQENNRFNPADLFPGWAGNGVGL